MISPAHAKLSSLDIVTLAEEYEQSPESPGGIGFAYYVTGTIDTLGSTVLYQSFIDRLPDNITHLQIVEKFAVWIKANKERALKNVSAQGVLAMAFHELWPPRNLPKEIPKTKREI